MSYYDDIQLEQFARDMHRAGRHVCYESYPEYVGRKLVALYYGPGVVADAEQLATIEAATTIDVVGLPLSGDQLFVCPKSLELNYAARRARKPG